MCIYKENRNLQKRKNKSDNYISDKIFHLHLDSLQFLKKISLIWKIYVQTPSLRSQVRPSLQGQRIKYTSVNFTSRLWVYITVVLIFSLSGRQRLPFSLLGIHWGRLYLDGGMMQQWSSWQSSVLKHWMSSWLSCLVILAARITPTSPKRKTLVKIVDDDDDILQEFCYTKSKLGSTLVGMWSYKLMVAVFL